MTTTASSGVALTPATRTRARGSDTREAAVAWIPRAPSTPHDATLTKGQTHGNCLRGSVRIVYRRFVSHREFCGEGHVRRNGRSLGVCHSIPNRHHDGHLHVSPLLMTTLTSRGIGRIMTQPPTRQRTSRYAGAVRSGYSNGVSWVLTPERATRSGCPDQTVGPRCRGAVPRDSLLAHSRFIVHRLRDSLTPKGGAVLTVHQDRRRGHVRTMPAPPL